MGRQVRNTAFAALALLTCASVANAAGARCDRDCLNGIADQYFDALAARNASSLPLAGKVRYTENGQALDLTDGLWATANAVGKYRQHFTDTRAGEVGTFATIMENGARALMSTRLKVKQGKITEIETVIQRASGAPMPGLESGSQRLERIGANPLWNQEIPASERMTRDKLIETANKYFVALQNNDGKGEYPFTDDCVRLENGNQTTGNPVMAELADKEEANPGPMGSGRPTAYGYRIMSFGCRKQFETGFMRVVTRIRDRRFPIVDVERGVVYTLVFFDHAGTVHEVTTTDGKRHPIGLRAPFTWELAEAFKIEKGQIRFIEAVLTQAPYGMKPNWPR